MQQTDTTYPDELLAGLAQRPAKNTTFLFFSSLFLLFFSLFSSVLLAFQKCPQGLITEPISASQQQAAVLWLRTWGVLSRICRDRPTRIQHATTTALGPGNRKQPQPCVEVQHTKTGAGRPRLSCHHDLATYVRWDADCAVDATHGRLTCSNDGFHGQNQLPPKHHQPLLRLVNLL